MSSAHSSVWICHQCGQQVHPRTVNGSRVCSECHSDFLEEISLPDDDSPLADPSFSMDLLRDLDEYDLGRNDDEDDYYDVPGAFPTSHDEPSGSATPPLTQRQRTNPPLFRMGVRGGTLTFGGGGGTPSDGRRSGRGASFAGGGGDEPLLRTSYQEGVPTLSEFMAGVTGGPARARSPRSPTQQDPFQALFGMPTSGPGRRPPAQGAQIDLGDVIGGLLGAFAGVGPSRGGNEDPYLAMLRSRGGLGAFLGGGGMFGGNGQFGDFATSQEAFDHIVTNLAQAAGASNQPPPASKEKIDSLPLVPISDILLSGMESKDCPICMSDFEVGETGMKAPCTHFFHQGCLRTWLETNGTCPVCRYSLVDESLNASSSSTGNADSRQSSISRTSTLDRPSGPTSAEEESGMERGGALVRANGAAAGTGVRAREEDFRRSQ